MRRLLSFLGDVVAGCVCVCEGLGGGGGEGFLWGHVTRAAMHSNGRQQLQQSHPLPPSFMVLQSHSSQASIDGWLQQRAAGVN